MTKPIQKGTDEPTKVKPERAHIHGAFQGWVLQYVNGPHAGQALGLTPGSVFIFASINKAHTYAMHNGLVWQGPTECPPPPDITQRREAIATANAILNNHNMPNLHVLARELGCMVREAQEEDCRRNMGAIRAAERILDLLKKAL